MIKECSEYAGLAGEFSAQITSSNLEEIVVGEQGSSHAEPAGEASLDT